MNVHCRCEIDASKSDRQANVGGEMQPPGVARRCFNVAEWLVPSTVLALMPKCPACVAAYVALVTGIGIPVTAATYIRTTLGVLCIASLVFLATRWMRRAIRRVTTPFEGRGRTI